MQTFFVPVLGAVVVLSLAGAVLVAKGFPRKPSLSEEERAELARAPMPDVMKRGIAGFIIAVVTLGTVSGILTKVGAMTYWEDDNLRLVAVGIFLAGLISHVTVSALFMAKAEAQGRIDERDRAVLARAPTAQGALVLIGLAVWCLYLTRAFRTEGAIPVVYLYLIFGSVLLLYLLGHSLGILVGYWLGGRDAQG